MTRYLSVEQQDASTPAQPTATPTPASGQTAYVNTASGSLNLRQAPSSSARVITAIPRGTAIVVTAYDAAWATIAAGDATAAEEMREFSNY